MKLVGVNKDVQTNIRLEFLKEKCQTNTRHGDPFSLISEQRTFWFQWKLSGRNPLIQQERRCSTYCHSASNPDLIRFPLRRVRSTLDTIRWTKNRELLNRWADQRVSKDDWKFGSSGSLIWLESPRMTGSLDHHRQSYQMKKNSKDRHCLCLNPQNCCINRRRMNHWHFQISLSQDYFPFDPVTKSLSWNFKLHCSLANTRPFIIDSKLRINELSCGLSKFTICFFLCGLKLWNRIFN